MIPMITVKCGDGHIRHEPFPTMPEAMEWAEWGHCCLGTHTFERLQEPERKSA